jgi:MYXO-CTERM domain-containing protein
VTRVVKDASGKIIHTDHWSSHYTAVDGQLQIGITPSPSPTPISTPTPSQSPPPSPALLVPPLAMLLGVWRRRMTWRRKSK